MKSIAKMREHLLSVSYKPIFTTMKKIKLFLLAITRLRTTFSRYVVFRLVLDYILKHKELPQAKITNKEME